ncbi:MAG TPA: heavy metal translocating P-type ATPase [Gemmatimonadaceae bacterium]|nr:heavy metal translocating P-type ATPase [Gemmatimonadaceae bacterium]
MKPTHDHTAHGKASAHQAAPPVDAHDAHTMHRHAAPASPDPRSMEDPTHHRGHAGHDRHAGHSVAMFRDKFWLSLLLTIPTVLWGHMLQGALGWSAPHFRGSHWIPAVFGTAVFAYGGWPFLAGAIGELKNRLPGMMTLIALAISVAFVFSAAVVLGFPGMPLWEELATLVVIMLLGHWIEMRSITQAQGALKELARLLPDRATRVEGEELRDVAVSELRDGDIVLLRPGGRVPADGAVHEGASQIDESMLTGESKPVGKKPGDQVIAGTINLSGALRVQITSTGERTALAGIMRLVEQAQQSKSRAQAVADRAAFLLTIIAIVAGVLTLAAWLVLRGDEPAFAVERMVTVLVIACPHALGLAVPLVIAISTTMGARGGLLVRDRRGLEEARNLTTVVFDKTGTLTLGEHRVVDIATAEGVTADDALRLAAAIERDSEHPIARAIVKSAGERSLSIPASSDFNYVAGRGVSATVEGRKVAGGGPNLLKELGVDPEPSLRDAAERAASRGQSTIYLIEGNRAIAAFAVADAIRPESKEAIRRLHAEGIEVVMITGDSEAVARAVAGELGIDQVLSQVLPEDKARRIEELQAKGKKVAMVGDGVNDAPALTVADVGVAIGAGTQVAVEAGDVVLVRSDPRDVPRIVRLSRASYRKMIQNLWWAAGYNIVAIPLAAGVLASRGVILSPAMGAVLMSASTIIVAINAQLLRREHLG